MPPGPTRGPQVAQRAWTLRGRLGTAFSAVAVLLIVFGVIAVFAATRFVRSGNDVINRWNPAAQTSERLQADLVNQETGLRGYVLTHQTRFLAPYDTFRARQASDDAQLRELIGTNPRLSRSLTRFEQAADEWRRTVAAPSLAAVRTGRGNEMTMAQAGIARFDLIRSRSATLIAQLESQAQVSRAARVTDGYWTIVFAALAALMVAVSGMVLWRGLNRWVLGPVDRLAGQIRVVSAGERQREIVADGPVELTELGHDVETMRMLIATQLEEAERTQEELLARGEELARSNDDLQQFAYVASHDLSEPLRKVANFCQLLERQYGDELDDRARQYIDFAVDGAKRMQALITDLLALSRVGRTTETFSVIDLNAKLALAISNLGQRVPEDAVIDVPEPLPSVHGDRALLISLLENLVGNALKYRRPEVPARVRITAERAAGEHVWTFTVSDNGIGIDAVYQEKIFAVFQRLHLRDQYGGTGIGLALCRKIVQFHGGRIWLEPVESRQGATFRFTLPEGSALGESRD